MNGSNSSATLIAVKKALAAKGYKVTKTTNTTETEKTTIINKSNVDENITENIKDILGAGTVGLGTYKLCEAMSDEIKHKTGATLVIKKVLVRNLSKKREGIPDEILTDKWEDIINDKDISIVVELMGGIHPAKDYVLEALKAGRQVVTANKDLIAEYGEEVGNAANKAGADLQFEAAVAGAIPIIRPLKQSMTGNHITEIMGIVNGTTNYILTKMTESGMDYKEALAKATELGYAEADPTADVEGLDAGRKMAILACVAFNSRVTFADVHTEGITKISARDIRYARDMGHVIKLLGVARNTEKGVGFVSQKESPPSRGAWIEIAPRQSSKRPATVAPLAGGVD